MAITFETQEDFENAVRKFLENNLRVVSDKTDVLDHCEDRIPVVTDVYLTFNRDKDYFTCT